jgi:hypothetical protein
MRSGAILLIMVLFSAVLFPVSLPAASGDGGNAGCDSVCRHLPTTDEMQGWIRGLWQLGSLGRYGYRMPGTLVDRAGAYYLKARLEDFGLEEVFLEPVPASVSFPHTWGLTARAGGQDRTVDCCFLRYAGFTPRDGITAPLVYAGTGSRAEFDAAGDLSGRIVIVDITTHPASAGMHRPISRFPEAGLSPREGADRGDLDSTYHLAHRYGAAGFIAVIAFGDTDTGEYLHWYADGSIPGLSVSRSEGRRLTALLSEGPVTATMTLTGYEGQGTVYNVYGTVPGKHFGTDRDRFIVLQTPYDGWASSGASQASVAIAVARCFMRIPRESREHSILVYASGGYFGKRPDWSGYDCYAFRLVQERLVSCAVVLEASVRESAPIAASRGKNRPGPRGGASNGPAPSGGDFGIPPEEIRATVPDRHGTTTDAEGLLSEASRWQAAGVPAVGHSIGGNPRYSRHDTPETVHSGSLRPIAAGIARAVQDLDHAF